VPSQGLRGHVAGRVRGRKDRVVLLAFAQAFNHALGSLPPVSVPRSASVKFRPLGQGDGPQEGSSLIALVL
jgi:hypothetical protein